PARRTFLLLPYVPCVPSLWGPVPTALWLRSPLERGHFFCRTCINCMADMFIIVLPTRSVEFIRRVSLRRVPYPPPSEQVSRHRTGIVSSSFDHGSLAERISSPLLSALLSIWLRPYQWPCLRTGPFFAPAGRQCNQAFTAALPKAHQAHWRIPWALLF